MNEKEFTRSISMLPDEELASKYDEYYERSRILYNEQQERKVKPWKHFEGKYVKVIEADESLPTYLHVDKGMSVTKSHSGSQYELHLSGNGFRGEFEEYKDMNWFDWSWWTEIRMPIDSLMTAEEDRSNGKKTTRYSITEITKEEYMNKFTELVNNMTEAFVDIVEFDDQDI